MPHRCVNLEMWGSYPFLFADMNRVFKNIHKMASLFNSSYGFVMMLAFVQLLFIFCALYAYLKFVRVLASTSFPRPQIQLLKINLLVNSITFFFFDKAELRLALWQEGFSGVFVSTVFCKVRCPTAG